MVGMVCTCNKQLTSDQCKKAATLAEALKLQQVKPQEASQVKLYILGQTKKQTQSHTWFEGPGSNGSQLFLNLSCAVGLERVLGQR